MQVKLVSFLVVIYLSMSNLCMANWIDLNTGINDELTGVVFRGDTGVVSGNALYYTVSGGTGAASWTKYDILGNPSDSLIYSSTKFSHCYSATADANNVFACGVDTTQNRAVILHFSLSTLTHSFIYIGGTGTQLNNIGHSSLSNKYFAVGANGLIVQFSALQNGSVVSTPLNQNLSSISFFNGECWIGADGYKIYGFDANPGITITTNDALSIWDVEDVLKISSTDAFGAGNFAYHTSNGSTSLLSNYDFGPLNAQCVFMRNGLRYIGTDHGIFRTISNTEPSSSNPFEWQTLSLGHSINEFWAVSDAEPFYACGENGVILKTGNYGNGGSTKPYVSVYMNPNDGCENEWTSLYSHMGSATNGTWYIDGQVVSTSDGFYSNIYDSAGVYQIDYIGTSWTGSDTANFSLEITAIPDDSINLTILDNIICHSESVEIIIDSSESNVFYTLHNLLGDEFGDSPNGNGALLNYTTNAVSDSGWYYLLATSSINENCQAQVLEEIYIEAEWTTANFHASHVNCEPNEVVQYYDLCRDADNYAWTFEPNANTGLSNLPEPQNSYNGASSPAQIELICWSNNGCSDTIYKNGPNIEALPAVVDTSWVSANKNPLEAPYGQDPAISRMIPVQDGYLISGKYFEETLASRFGDSVNYLGAGNYLVKYDFRGMLKWSMFCDGAISNMAEDQNGNLYITGLAATMIVDNRNDTILTPSSSTFYPEGFILKLDALGKTQWFRKSNNIRPYQVAIGEDNLPVFGAYTADLIPGIVTLGFNGTPMDTIAVNIGTFNDQLILKFDTAGVLQWHVLMTIEGTNIRTIRDIEIDSDNNIYVTGAYEHKVVTYPTNQSVGDTLDGYASVYGGHLFLTKLTELGGLIWQTRAISTDSQFGPEGGTAPYDLVLDDQGSCYISGTNDSGWYTLWFQFHNTNGTVHNSKGGRSFIMKIDSSGICSWIKCGQYSYYGGISRLHLENDNLYALGWIDESNSFVGIPDVTFLNDDSTSITIEIDRPNYFIATFDTTGYIHSVFKNSDDVNYPNSAGLTNDWAGFFKHSDGSFYTTRNMFLYPNTTYDEFGHTMSTEDYDSWVVKAMPGNGINVPPIYLIQVEDTVCAGTSYTLPNGTIISPTASLIDTTTMVSSAGLDSVIITNLVISTAFNWSESVSVCSGNSYSFPDGSSSVITSPTTHLSYLVSAGGCDSIITTNVSVLQGAQIDEYLSVCPGSIVTYPDGQTDSITGPANHVSILPIAGGCDSTITTHVSVFPSQYITNFDTVCVGSNYVFEDGFSTTILGSTFHESSFINSNGCDSVIAKEVNVYPEINASISIVTGDLEAQPAGLSYQWYSCIPDLIPLSGETNATLNPPANGLYAVAISDGSCIDTSACFTYDNSSLAEGEQNTFTVYPNPTNQHIQIGSTSNAPFDLKIVDLQGKLILSLDDVISQDILSISHLAAGSYLLMIEGLTNPIPLIKY